MESQDDPALREIHNRSGLTVPDGVPMVWAGRFAGARQIERVYGPRMMDAVCELAARNNWRTFLYGGSPDVVDRLRDRLERRYRDLEIVGSLSPPFRGLTPDEDSEVVETIRGLAPQIVWVGLSTPKQERWMAEHLHHMPSPCVMFGVGAAFDIHAGVRREAPEWVGRLGLQWLFRLAQEPRRLWRRYLMNNPRFVLEIVRRRPVIVNKREAASSETAGSLH
jgi:N-acetylglucosaminyldiphosphoundecaprenol N-acetyl-beta-D-mannosaminyltransferase